MANADVRIESEGGGRPKTKTRLKGVGPSDVARPDGLPSKIGRYEVLKVIGKGAMREAELQNLSRRLDQTGNPRDAAALIRARRAMAAR